MNSKLNPAPDFPKVENEILKFWEENGVVKEYLKKNEKSDKRFRFIDGPITANNPMGVHHAWGRTLKDFFQRYKNMRGFAQRFQNGFDCQGLWLEVEEEKNLGFNSKRDIESYGIDKFSLACRSRVEKYSRIQTEQSKRLGMFMDWDNSYYTMSETNNLYIWFFLKKCHEKKLLYKGKSTMPWCTRCGTGISAHELSDSGYKTVEHDSVYVKFSLINEPNNFLLIWTTTPWTLLANVAVAVNPSYDYVKVKVTADDGNEQSLILSKNRLSILNSKYEITDEFKGEKLIGVLYSGPFDEIDVQKSVAHSVIPWEEVSEGEGTGLVHIAPGAGEEDFQLGKKYNLSVIAPLDEFGVYLSGFGEFSGKEVSKINPDVFKSLKEKSLLYKIEKITHSYPHCWRCKEPLVFRVTEEWFIKSDPVRDDLKSAASKVNWVPEFAGKRMLDWLNNMGDWPISRHRYWGLALPFYECQKCKTVTVIGSKEELKLMATQPDKVDGLPELHRPWIDEIKIKCPNCQSDVSRTPFVGDCWLDAGIVPFSTLKYLEDKSYWQKWFPAEFVTEYIAQIKLWFYSLLFMSVVIENKAPYETVLTDGYVVDEKGEVMHKSKGNAIWFDEGVEKMGADMMRWLYLRSDTAKDMRFGYNLGDEVRRRFFLILWNCFKFVHDSASCENVDLDEPTGEIKNDLDILDRWIISRLNSLIKSVTESIEKYNTQAAVFEIESFVDEFSTWYIRRSRKRVGAASSNRGNSLSFYRTSFHVFKILTKILAPFSPFFSESLYQYLKDGKLSVHLHDWPDFNANFIDTTLEERMKSVRKICELGHSARKASGVKVRQPLQRIIIKSAPKNRVYEGEFIKLIADELNVKSVEYLDSNSEEFSIELDVNITPELRAEGEARELIRAIQQLRKEKACGLSDSIQVLAPSWPEEHEELIKKETIATKISKTEGPLMILTQD